MKIAVGLICCVLLVSGVSRAQQADVGTDAQREAGKQVYDHKCGQCHGEDGDGNGVAKAYFSPTPRDFTFGTYKIRSTPSGDLPSHEDLKRVIRNGMPYTGMPAWPGLSEEELSNVVYYIKRFAEGFADPDMVVPPIEIPKAPRFSAESAEKGRAVYQENKCDDCHGNLGRGDGKSAPTLTNDWDEPVRPADMTKRWTFRGGSSREDIYRTFTTGLNGTPMPSYADLIGEEDRWHLVDYVYSLSRDNPEYSTVVMAIGIEADIDLANGDAVFADAPPAVFPVFGQIIEPGRVFYPSANAIEMRAVYNASEIAIMLTWHDMTLDASGTNSPSLPAPRFDPEAHEDDVVGAFSDAVAFLTPSTNMPGFVKPYFLFGDARNYMDIWFADLAKDEGELFIGRGSQSIEPVGPTPISSTYDDGQWKVIFKRSRQTEGGLSFDEGSFIPVAFSVWDGFNGERGNKRGVSSWYHMYLKPLQAESKVGRIAGFGIVTLLIEVAVIGVVRKRNGLSVEQQHRRSEPGPAG